MLNSNVTLEVNLGQVDFAAVWTVVCLLQVFLKVLLQPPLESE
jgi:hypothetical protein